MWHDCSWFYAGKWNKKLKSDISQIPADKNSFLLGIHYFCDNDSQNYLVF